MVTFPSVSSSQQRVEALAIVTIEQSVPAYSLRAYTGPARKPVTNSFAKRNTARASSILSGSWLANITAWRRCQFSSFMPPLPFAQAARRGRDAGVVLALAIVTATGRAIRSIVLYAAKRRFVVRRILLAINHGEGPQACRTWRAIRMPAPRSLNMAVPQLAQRRSKGIKVNTVSRRNRVNFPAL
jgi:hypothetical protein